MWGTWSIFTKGDDGVYNLFEVVPLVQNDTVTVEVPLGGKDGTEPINYYILETDADGNIHADNLSAYWIPQLTLQKEIGGTVYTVTGYYEGKTDFIRKLERMTVDRMRRAMEGDTDDK